MKEEKFDLFLENINKIQKDNPKEFEEKIEKVKEELKSNKWEEKINKLDGEKKEKFYSMMEQIESLKNNTDKEERMKLYEELKDQLSPEEKLKMQKLAKLLKGIIKK